MRTRKTKPYKNHQSKKSRKGGFFSTSRKTLPECDINNLSMLSKQTNDGQDPLIKMQTNYQQCCPKDFMGRKNSSPYCKQLDANFKALSNYQRDIDGYYGDETDVSKIKKIMNEPANAPISSQPISSQPISSQPMLSQPMTAKKPWYKFWGGKKHRRTRHRKKRTYRRK
jgi:hypothetical protein